MKSCRPDLVCKALFRPGVLKSTPVSRSQASIGANADRPCFDLVVSIIMPSYAAELVEGSPRCAPFFICFVMMSGTLPRRPFPRAPGSSEAVPDAGSVFVVVGWARPESLMIFAPCHVYSKVQRPRQIARPNSWKLMRRSTASIVFLNHLHLARSGRIILLPSLAKGVHQGRGASR